MLSLRLHLYCRRRRVVIVDRRRAMCAAHRTSA